MGGGHGGVSGGGSRGSGGGVSPVGGAGKFPWKGSHSLFSSSPGLKSKWRLVEIPGDSPLPLSVGVYIL